MPNIFERARAYDNWNEGNFQPQEDGYGSISDKYNDYKEVYNQLTDEEKSLSYRYPFLAVKIKENREKAFRATNHFDGITDGYGNAVRHCYWCVLNTPCEPKHELNFNDIVIETPFTLDEHCHERYDSIFIVYPYCDTKKLLVLPSLFYNQHQQLHLYTLQSILGD